MGQDRSSLNKFWVSNNLGKMMLVSGEKIGPEECMSNFFCCNLSLIKCCVKKNAGSKKVASKQFWSKKCWSELIYKQAGAELGQAQHS